MAYTYVSHTGDGVRTVFDFQFTGEGYGYFRKSDIYVSVAKQPVGFTLVGTNQVQLVTPPPLGSLVMIRRIMPKDEPYARWERGNNFNARNTNNSFLQQLYLVQELYDGFLPDDFTIRTDIDFGGYRATNLGAAINDGDAVTLGQLKGWDTSSLNAAIRAEAARDRAILAEERAKASALEAAEAAKQAVGGVITYVVGTPTITLQSEAENGYEIPVKANAVHHLTNGVRIAAFEFTKPGGSMQMVSSTDVDAISGTASIAYVVNGAIGEMLTFGVVAIDSHGNRSRIATAAVKVGGTGPVDPGEAATPTTPSATTQPTVTQGSTGNTVVISGSTVTDGSTITYRIDPKTSGFVFSKVTGIAEGEVVTYTAPVASQDIQVTFDVWAVTSAGGTSAKRLVLVTIIAIPDVPGTPFGGGYYFGRVKVGTDTYALIVAPKSTEVSKAYKTTNVGIGTAARSNVDGFSNTGNPGATYPAGNYCRALRTGGFSDWYHPAKNELELLYRNLKPTTGDNYTMSGLNPDSVPPGDYYTAQNPAQTSAVLFKEGGSEALRPDGLYSGSTTEGYDQPYSCAIKVALAGACGWMTRTDFTSPSWVRPIRRVKIG